MSVNNFPELFQWCYDHMMIIGWPALFISAWKISKIFNEMSAIVVKTVDQIDSMAINHFPHMQESLKNQDGLLKSVDTHLKTLVEGQATFMTPRRRAPRKSRQK
jgi:hypothetical protein